MEGKRDCGTIMEGYEFDYFKNYPSYEDLLKLKNTGKRNPKLVIGER